MTVPAGGKFKLVLAVVLSLTAVGTVIWAVMPHRPASGPSVAAGAAVHGSVAPPESLDPRLHLDLLLNAEQIKYEGRGKNIFRADSEPVKIEPVKITPLLRKQQEMARHPGPPTPPPPPPINLKYFGLASHPGEKTKAFLSRGDDVWIASEGDVVNRRYKIVRITPREAEIEDLLNNHRESVPLSQN